MGKAVKGCDTASQLDGRPLGGLDLGRITLSQDFVAMTSVSKRIVKVPVRRPNNTEFVRVHPDSGYRLKTRLLDLKDLGEQYVVDSSLWPELDGELVAKELYLAINRQNDVFIWPVRLPDQDGRLDPWNESAAQAAGLATRKWVRIRSNRAAGMYDVYEASSSFSDPVWPQMSFQELLDIAFRGRLIDKIDHPVIRRLRGEV